MEIIANIIGIFAVVTFVLSYQMKTRKGIVLCNSVSRVLYVVQYLLLFAFEGAVLDIVGIAAAVLAQTVLPYLIPDAIKLILALRLTCRLKRFM